MNPDVTYASCDAPQEKTDAEVELDEDGNEVWKEKTTGFCSLFDCCFFSSSYVVSSTSVK